MQATDWTCLRLGIALSFLLAGGMVYAQPDNRNSTTQNEKFSYTFPGDIFSSNVRLNEIKPAAFRSFRRQFSAVQNESWSKLRTGYLVRFRDPDSNLNYAFLDKRGVILRKIVCYSGNHVPSDLKEAVHYVYRAFEIESATKWSVDRNEYYGIVINHDGDKKSLEFKNGEFFVLAEYNQISFP